MDIMIRGVTPDMKAAIVAAAKSDGRSMNNFLRRLLAEHFAPPTRDAASPAGPSSAPHRPPQGGAQ